MEVGPDDLYYTQLYFDWVMLPGVGVSCLGRGTQVYRIGEFKLFYRVRFVGICIDAHTPVFSMQAVTNSFSQ